MGPAASAELDDVLLCGSLLRSSTFRLELAFVSRRQMVFQSLRLAVLVRLRRLVWLWWRSHNKDSSIVPARHDSSSGLARLCVPDCDDMARANLGAICAAGANSRDVSNRQNQSRPPASYTFPRADGRTPACSPAGCAGPHLKMAA